MKYLYYIQRHGNEVFRVAVSRETDSNIWIKNRDGETKLSKKTYQTGSGWDSCHYYEETPDLLKRYTEDSTRRKFIAHLDKLKSCKDISVMQYVLNIKIESATQNCT